MAQRGRKSAEQLRVLAQVHEIPRAGPPSHLSDFEASVWVSVVNTKPADWFGTDTIPLLVSYCKHVSHAAVIDKEIADFNLRCLRDDGEGLKTYKTLLDMRDKESRAITALARSMRLTQQSQILPDVAGNNARHKTSEKLWDS